MKLYTEEQVRKAIEFADEYNYLLKSEKNDIISSLTPIELPSDEELKKQFDVDEFDPYDLAYLGGAIWMRNKIQGNDKQ